MRILFLSTNVRSYHPTDVYPMGVGALSAWLKQFGHETKGFVASKVSEFPLLRKVLREFQPDLVAYSVIAGQSPNIPLLTKIVKQWSPSVPFICGGAHPSLAPDAVLAMDGVDAVCIGDGELALQELVEGLERGEWNTSVHGFWFKTKDGEILRNPTKPFVADLDSLPYHDREVVDFQRIIDRNTGILWMLASRGCQWGCTFCSVSLLKTKNEGEYTRNRSVDHVMGELRQLFDRYQFKIIIWRDDTFTWDRDWTLEFTRRYAEEFGSFPYAVFSRGDCLDEEVVQGLAKSGCQAVWLGYESGDDYLRNEVIRKEIDTEEFIAACDRLNRYGVRPYVLNIVGLPYESRESFQQTIEVNRRIHEKYPMFSLGSGTGPKIFTFEPFPGTPLHELCADNGWLREERLKVGFRTHVDSYVDIPTFPKEEVLQQYRRFRYNVYKGNHNLIAWFYLVYDSAPGEALREVLPTKLFVSGIDFFLRIVRQDKARAGLPMGLQTDVPAMDAGSCTPTSRRSGTRRAAQGAARLPDLF